jgi:catechol 2,3-dioxygenase-like lactoylglutathione lyase family enzyme
MTILRLVACVLLALLACHGGRTVTAQAPATQTLEPPSFHHLHLSSPNPDAATAAYMKLWPATTERTTVEGVAALRNGAIYLLFDRTAKPLPTTPQSAYRHQVWLTPDVRAYVKRAQAAGMTVEPLYTSEEGGIVEVSTDTYPGTLTKSGLADAKQKGVPTRMGGYTYVKGPDGLIVEGFERAGDKERLAQIDMWQEDPVCAELWYARHLGGSRRAPANGPAPTEDNCKTPPGEPTWPSTMKQGTRRVPVGRVGYGDVALLWYTNPGSQPLVSTRGQAADHIAFAVRDLDAWVAKLRHEKVTILREPYAFGSSRAVLIEGPSREAIELLQIR